MAQGVLDRLTLQSGDFVFKEGEEGNQAYVVQEGTIDIVRKNSEGEDIVLGTVEKGGIFGEMALIDSKPRMAMARCSKGSTIIIVSRAMFEEKLSKSDPFIRGLLNILVNNIRELS